MAKFTGKLTAWASKSEARADAVFKTAAQDLANEVRVPKGAGGNMPVLTGNLRRSLMASLTEMPSVKDGPFFNPDDQITLTIAGAKVGDTIYMGFQAIYARRMEYGFVGEDSLGRHYNQKGNGFVRLAAMNWPSIVRNAAQRIKAKVEGG